MSVIVHESKKSENSTNPVVIKTEQQQGGEKEKSSKRSGKTHFPRAGSFRNKHRTKLLQEIEAMAGYGKNKGDSRFWRIRHFGHYDLQSVSVDRIEYQANKGDSEQRLKKHTGASAAILNQQEVNGIDSNIEQELGNHLVAQCPSFSNEFGSNWLPKDSPLLKLKEVVSQEKKMRIYSRERAVLDSEFVTSINGGSSSNVVGDLSSCQVFTVQSGTTYPLEYMDYGACYYRQYFYGKDHYNFVGSEDGIGPIVISLKREKVTDSYQQTFSQGQPANDRGSPKHHYRIIVRTSELPTLRGTIMEETIPTSSKSSSNRGIPPREVIEYVTQGEVQISTLKLAKSDEKVHREIMRVDEQELTNKYKIGVLYCKAGQTSEEEWYNNEHSSPAFDEFLELIGMKVKMKGFSKYRAQLDNKTDTTGEFSVYTEYEQSEMMFHVSTLLPFTDNNKQQLLRKRHIGNDIVTLIFQEPGSEPFSPKTIRSHFQHIFIIVRVTSPNTPLTEYEVAVSRSSDVPYFGPRIPDSGIFQKSEKFRNFILTKLMNACNAALRSDKLYAMASRTRKQYLGDIVKEHASSVSLEQVGGGALGRLFGRKRERFGLTAPLMFTPGAMTWCVSIIARHWKPLPFSEEHDFSIECILALSADVLVLIDNDKISVLNIPTRDICGFSVDKNRLNLFYDNIYCLSFEFQTTSEEDIQDFCKRLMTVSPAQEAILLEFSRSVISGLLGFTIDQDGAVVKVDGLAKMRGLQKGARVLQVEDKLMCCHPYQEIADLLHNKHQTILRAFVIPPVHNFDRPALSKTTIDWEKVLSLRPQMPSEMANTNDTNEDKSRSEKGSPDPSEISDADAMSQKCYSDIVGNSHGRGSKSRKYRPNHLTVVNPNYDDDENIYDRLLTYERSPGGGVAPLNPPGSPSNRSTASSMGPASPVSSTGKGYSRVKISSHKKSSRQSVLPIKIDQRSVDNDSVEDEGFLWTPVPVHHHIDDTSPHVNTRVSQSTPVPDRSQVASPLSYIRKPVTPGALGERNPLNLPHSGTVQEMAKKFTQFQSKPPLSRNYSNARKVPIVVRQDQRPSLTGNNISRGNRSPKRRINRPQSCELNHLPDNVPIVDSNRGESLPPMSDDDMTEPVELTFRRTSQARQPFRSKTNPPSEVEYEFDKRTCKTEDDNISDVTPVPPPTQLMSQQSSDDSYMAATKVLEELEKYMSEDDTPVQDNESVKEEKINKLSVRARTHLWEMKAHHTTSTLPKSFKTRTKSQPCSPLKTTNSNGSIPNNDVQLPSTPKSQKLSVFSFTNENNSELSLQRPDEDPSAIISRTPTNSVTSHKTLPLPKRKPKKKMAATTSNGGEVPVRGGTHDNNQYYNDEEPPSHYYLPADNNQLNYDNQPKELSWDSVMGDISNYCRNVAEWVRQTESAGVLDTPPQPPDSPIYSETCSFTTTSFQSDNTEKLKQTVEKLADKLDQEAESNKELRYHLKKMEKQISELQNRQTIKNRV